MNLEELRSAYNEAVERMNELGDSLEEALEQKANDPEADVDVETLETDFDAQTEKVEELKTDLDKAEARARSRERHKPVEIPEGEQREPLRVSEADLYVKNGRKFLADLYMAQMKGDPAARERIDRHQASEAEKRAVATGTLGGIIPPAYLIELYAKASRNGRVFADQVNHQELPEQGMSVVVPRITVGLAAGVQATESTALTTQDPTEVDLSVPVRTIGGYSPVSRQTLERASYSDEILFEDLIARYWAALDTQCISGSGAAGQILGALNTAGIATSTASTATVAGVWPKIADLIQQINSNLGGIGYVASKIVMHPRRWGFFAAALDSQNRPLMPVTGAMFNVMGEGNEAGYGFVGNMHGLPVFTDANIPTNLGAGTNEDRILVFADPVSHLWERPEDPVTLSFEQQAGTSLQVQLIAYGYAAFTAGRYPGAFGVVSGAGLVPPTF